MSSFHACNRNNKRPIVDCLALHSVRQIICPISINQIKITKDQLNISEIMVIDSLCGLILFSLLLLLLLSPSLSFAFEISQKSILDHVK